MTIQGRKIQIPSVTFRFIDSRGGLIGPDSEHLYEAFTQETISANQANLEFNETYSLNPSTALYSGDIKVIIGSEYKSGGRFFFRNSDPRPVQIGAVYPDINLGGSTEA